MLPVLDAGTYNILLAFLLLLFELCILHLINETTFNHHLCL